MLKNAQTEKKSQSYAGLVSMGMKILSRAGIDEPSRDARLLLLAAANRDRAAFIMHPDEIDMESVSENYTSFLNRRIKREPVQYIIGKWEFMGMPFIVNRDVLIPRPETERLVECVIEELSDKSGNAAKPLRILDLCTGSGCIAVSLAAYLRDSAIIATDISSDALRTAQNNALLNNVQERVLFLDGDMFYPVEMLSGGQYNDNTELSADAAAAALSVEQCESRFTSYGDLCGGLRFDAICANPPYIAGDELAFLPDDVRLYEPGVALDGGADGLSFYYRIAEGASRWLEPGGLLAMETGLGQARNVGSILIENGYANVRTIRDYAGNERVVLAYYHANIN
jgi:release factor glutamine methyltransferase